MKKSLVLGICLLLGVAVLSSAGENRYQQFNAEVEQAYAAYRKALFQTNMKDAEKSGKATEMFLTQWSSIIEAYNEQPPEVFSTDPKWADTLSSIEEIAVKSAGQIKDGEVAEAHETLEAIRDELSDLRKRNSVVVFSDHINNYHAVMEELLVGGYTPDTINEAALVEIRGQLAVLNYLAEAIRDNAPQKYRSDQMYEKMEAGLFASLDGLQNALESYDPKGVSKAIKMLKPAYAKLFVNFG
jgi:predicted negative regulator of RcsB-dependent stress response